MNTAATKISIYRTINIALIAMMLMLFFLALALPGARAPIGIISRLILAVFTFVNSVWLFRARRSTLGGALLLLVGIGLTVTALMGYGFNGTPPTPWLFR